MNVSLSQSNSYVSLVAKTFDRQESYSRMPIQKSASASGIIESGRGFKPSDMFDPRKKEFMTNLSHKLLHLSKVSYFAKHIIKFS